MSEDEKQKRRDSEIEIHEIRDSKDLDWRSRQNSARYTDNEIDPQFEKEQENFKVVTKKPDIPVEFQDPERSFSNYSQINFAQMRQNIIC